MMPQVVILAGGKGTRLRPLTDDTPKPLLPINGRPFIQYLIENLRYTGFQNILLLVGPYRTDFESELGTGTQFGVEITYFSESEQAGTGTAIARARSHLEQSFLLLNGDTFFDFDIVDFIQRPIEGPYLARIALVKLESGARYGKVQLDGDYVLNFYEKANNKSAIVNAGAYFMDRNILDEMHAPPCSLETDILPALSKRLLVRGLLYPGTFIDIGVPEDLSRAQTILD